MEEELDRIARTYGLPGPATRALRDLLTQATRTVDPVAAPPPPDTPRSGLIAGRYEDLGVIGTGGMGEVRRVRDLELGRVVALKRIHAGLLATERSVARFREEARAMADLQHPNIVPVYDTGVDDAGRPFITMKEVRGRTLVDVIGELPFRELVTLFLTACRAVAFAHDRGILHRDLKPANIMVGELAEVYVLDWGLARTYAARDEPEPHAPPVHAPARRPALTIEGRALGTPAYMPPEQARGERSRIDARSDVYALGATLYTLLTGRLPFAGSTPEATLRRVIAGDTPPLDGGAPHQELVRICRVAMAPEPDDRYPDAGALAHEVQGWLADARRRERALQTVEQALVGMRRADELAAKAQQLRRASEELLAPVDPWDPEERKAPGWARAADAENAELEASLQQLQVDRALHAALRVDPELPEAHALLAERSLAQHAHAEARRDRTARSRAELRVREHMGHLPVDHPVRRDGERYLQADGTLTLVTDPPGAEVELLRYEVRNRRLVEVPDRSLGPTPLHGVRLPMGSYLCVLRCPGHLDVRYPIDIPRLGAWTGRPPGADRPLAVALPRADEVGPDEVYVPAGWTRVGGDPEAFGPTDARRLWCDAFFAQRFQVTNAQYIAFLDDLVAHDREDEALRYVPRERAGREGARGAPLYGRTASGGFELQVDEEGDVWSPQWPVIHVDWFGARAYATWLSARTGRPWRLPGELEWEKAARGVDGRLWPWGDHADPAWCRQRESQRGRPAGDYGPVDVTSYPVDTSVYGVRGTGGNVRDWCLDGADAARPPDGGRVRPPEAGDLDQSRIVRGGAWDVGPRFGRCASRNTFAPGFRYPFFGFRLFRSA